MSRSAQQVDKLHPIGDNYVEVTVKIPRGIYAYTEAWAKRTNKTVEEIISTEFQYREFASLDDMTALEIMDVYFPGMKKESEAILSIPERHIEKVPEATKE